MKSTTSSISLSICLGSIIFLLAACASVPVPPPTTVAPGRALDPIAIYQSIEAVSLGEPLGVTVDLHGLIFLADGQPGQLIQFQTDPPAAREFQLPTRNPGFLPSDIQLQGFFIYAVDKTGRALLRFDKDGAYRDMLLNFDEALPGRRVAPCGLAVDASGRMAITDLENHQILIYDTYLNLEKEFGNYGSFPGQLDSPEGVSFTPGGDLLVADTGNQRIQFFGTGGEFIKALPAEGQANPLVRPRRAVMSEDGLIYIADPAAGRLLVFDGAGHRWSLYPRGVEQFRPTDVEVTGSGRLYVTDAASRSLYVFKVVSD